MSQRNDEEKDLCLVYGPCSAEVIRRLLEASPAFSAEFRTLPIPAVHRVTASELAIYDDLLPQASLLIAHPITSGYRGLPLGTKEIAQRVSDDCRMLLIPRLFYQGLYPFQVYIHRGEPAPLTHYHDVRFMFCAAMGWDIARSASWLAGYTPQTGVLRQIEALSAARLRKYEASLDIRVAPRVTGSSVKGFFTQDHPTNHTLTEIVRGIHDALTLPYVPKHGGPELLGDLRTPLEPSVIAALGLELEPIATWSVRGKRYPVDEVLATHLAWYQRNPMVLQFGLVEYAQRLVALDLRPQLQ